MSTYLNIILYILMASRDWDLIPRNPKFWESIHQTRCTGRFSRNASKNNLHDSISSKDEWLTSAYNVTLAEFPESIGTFVKKNTSNTLAWRNMIDSDFAWQHELIKVKSEIIMEGCESLFLYCYVYIRSYDYHAHNSRMVWTRYVKSILYAM